MCKKRPLNRRLVVNVKGRLIEEPVNDVHFIMKKKQMEKNWSVMCRKRIQNRKPLVIL